MVAIKNIFANFKDIRATIAPPSSCSKPTRVTENGATWRPPRLPWLAVALQLSEWIVLTGDISVVTWIGVRTDRNIARV